MDEGRTSRRYWLACPYSVDMQAVVSMTMPIWSRRLGASSTRALATQADDPLSCVPPSPNPPGTPRRAASSAADAPTPASSAKRLLTYAIGVAGAFTARAAGLRA